MLFPVRCMFWLTVVYTSIAWPGVDGVGAPAPGAGRLAEAAVAKVTATFRTTATDACLAAPAACAEKIAAVSRLAENIVPVPALRPGRTGPGAPARGADTLRADDRTAAPLRASHVPG